MIRFIPLFILSVLLISSCRSTRKIQTAIAAKDTAYAKNPSDQSREDSLLFIRNVYDSIQKNRIDFSTFAAKVDVDYMDGDGKKYDVTAHLRMVKDSLIWISVRGMLGIEGLRALISTDSVKLLDKQNNIYTARSVAYLQEVSALPLDLSSLQDLLLGNPVFLDGEIVSYTNSDQNITLLSIGDFFKNLFTVEKGAFLSQSSKLDDLDEWRNRTCFLGYSGYDHKKGVRFATKRQITVTEKKKLDIKLEFKQYDFNETLNFPFNVPKNYKSN